VTKKDYIKIAKILNTTDLQTHVRASLAVSFASVCREDNSRFDVDRFLKACGCKNTVIIKVQPKNKEVG